MKTVKIKSVTKIKKSIQVYDIELEKNHFFFANNILTHNCRLKNDFERAGSAGYQNSFGVGGLSIGSHRVAGLNLPRMAVLEKDNKDILDDNLSILHKILYSHRQLIKERIQDGFLSLYTSNWIDLNKQYSTIGFIGANEYLKNKDLDIRTEKGQKEMVRVLKYIEESLQLWQKEEKEEHNIYNLEQIPGESMAIRLCEIDTELGFNPQKYIMYSNQYIPLIENETIHSRFQIQGKMDKLTSGGAILHINIDDEKPLSPKQFRKLIEAARDSGTQYFAVNYAYSECEQGHYTVGKQKNGCPICGTKIVNQFTRVVGFIVPTSSWSKTRRDWEYEKRVFYSNDCI